ncbi:histone acetyltransferase HPA2 protein [Catenovulum agarivorans DS-2]|uniref:Histone acetyltransferase HPA2 protein n=1 Tax=Catenovulum agarivorans DS-2 TaxID=1328313 RepID=W7R2B1_9ALTE|nr:GNAT family N-acetyltransferase [Catenovulum agarivorans]EWH11770.1 histone acetyltransferase HPA2 protein [Catenovulum agarivorans DS-2]
MISVIPTDITNADHQQALLAALNNYALDPMGGAAPLSDYVQQNLVNKLKQRSDYYGWLAFDGDKVIGLLNAFEGFSTFYAKPLLNIHDIAIDKDYRGQGLSKQLLNAAEQHCRTHDYCKLTLEVLRENSIAKDLYEGFGFAPYQLSIEGGPAEFWQKML